MIAHVRPCSCASFGVRKIARYHCSKFYALAALLYCVIDATFLTSTVESVLVLREVPRFHVLGFPRQPYQIPAGFYKNFPSSKMIFPAKWSQEFHIKIRIPLLLSFSVSIW